MKRRSLKSLSDKKNIKYTGINLALCALVVALVIILNAMIGVLSDKFRWQLDMTEEGIFTMSDKMKTTVGEMFTEKDVQIEIIFAAPEDEIEDAYGRSDTAGSIGYVYSTALDLEKEFGDNIEVNCYDIEKEYTFYKDNFYTDSGTRLSQNVVIVARKNPNPGTPGTPGYKPYNEYKVFHYQAFYAYDTNTGNLYAYNGEMVFTSAILGLVMDENPTVYFTWQHGETCFTNWDKDSEAIDFESVETSKDINSEALTLIKIFAQSGYSVKPIDLSTQNIPSDARSIVINNPTSDFSPEETKKLTDYFKSSGTIFCFTDYDVDLPNLYAFADANCGIEVSPSEYPVSDTLLASSTPYKLRAFVPENAAALSYFKTLSNAASAKALMNNANIVTIKDEFKSDEGYVEREYVKYVKPLLVTSANANFGGAKGTYNLMTITSAVKEDILNSTDGTMNKNEYSYFVMCPSSSFVSEEGLNSSSNANKKMMLALIHTLSSREDTPSLVDIDFKVFIEYDLDITKNQATAMTVIISTVLPVAFIIGGAVVIRRRKLR